MAIIKIQLGLASVKILNVKFLKKSCNCTHKSISETNLNHLRFFLNLGAY